MHMYFLNYIYRNVCRLLRIYKCIFRVKYFRSFIVMKILVYEAQYKWRLFQEHPIGTLDMSDPCTSIHLSSSPYGTVSCWNSNCLTTPDTGYSAGSLPALSYTHLGLPACPSYSHRLAQENRFLQMHSLEVKMPSFAGVPEYNGSEQVLMQSMAIDNACS